ncbi:type 1 fimbrial protein, partial [Escherichia coli]|nr:type 1 fimbrial protein [Escherichia coli]MBB8408379.1 type 1 fimbrial protein [Escherichia coli]
KIYSHMVTFWGNYEGISQGSTSLHFIAKYRATGRRVTGGIANAQAWFSLTYQ